MKIKPFMRAALIVLILLLVFLISNGNEDFAIIIENKRNQRTDSSLVYVRGERFIVDQLDANKRTSIKV